MLLGSPASGLVGPTSAHGYGPSWPARTCSMGMEAFAERARRELRATGETVRKRTVPAARIAGATDTLTAQEAQVARLARDGLSNPEIGARLFISPRTAAYHLSNVFTKLGISSRSQLDRVLPVGPDTTGPR
jgi:DNA-binding CsgD family transcriptional regulator